MKTLVIIPTYNESENVEWITKAILENQPQVNILIADDNSPDGTGDIADSLAENDARIFVLHRAGKEGLGAAYRAGFAWGLERDYDVLVEMDADGSHRPEDLGKLLESAEGGRVPCIPTHHLGNHQHRRGRFRRILLPNRHDPPRHRSGS